jgi:hypothetical protein
MMFCYQTSPTQFGDSFQVDDMSGRDLNPITLAVEKSMPLMSTLGINTNLIDQSLYVLFEAQGVSSGKCATGEATGEYV